MTILNVISAVIFVGVIVAIVVLYRVFKKETDAACGFCSINERGQAGTSREGDIVIEVDDPTNN